MLAAKTDTGRQMTPGQADPKSLVAELERRSALITTTCQTGKVVWRIWGSGPPVVLAHGAQGSWTHWIRNIEALAKHHSVIAVDLPGHGDSEMPAGDDHRAMVAPLASGLGQILPKGIAADFVGFSFGGVMLAYLAAYYPNLVRRLALVGSPGLETPGGDVHLQQTRGLDREKLRAVQEANLLALMLHDPESVDELAVHLLVTNGKKARLPTKTRADLVMPDKLAHILPKICAPLFAIWGGCDRPLPNPQLQEAALRKFRADLEFRTIPGAGHWVMYERSEQFNGVLLDLLGRG